MTTIPQITKQLKDLLTNGKNFEKVEIPNVDGIVIQKLDAYKGQPEKLCLFIGSGAKGTRIFDENRFNEVFEAINHSNTLKIAKIITKLNPEYKGNTSSGLKKLDMD